MNCEARFESLYGRESMACVQAPGRINLIGEHVDYLDGCVLPAAIDRRLNMLSAPQEGAGITIWSTVGSEAPAEISFNELRPRVSPEERWLNYVIGVLAGYRETGTDLPGFQAVITSDIPPGSGLSSSAALETATALTIEALAGVEKDVVDRALICQRAEHEFAGVPCGIMDQLAVGASRAGHATMIDCRDLSLRQVKIPDGIAMVVADTGVKHALADGEYRKRREDCEAAGKIIGVDSLRDATLDQVEQKRDSLGDLLFRRARHAVSEMARVERFSAALEASDAKAIGTLMRAGHDSLRDDFEVSCEELDVLVDAAYAFGPERGLLGSRMTGGGFGGSTVSLVREDEAPRFLTHLADAFEKSFGQNISPFITCASQGARILQRPTLSIT